MDEWLSGVVGMFVLCLWVFWSGSISNFGSTENLDLQLLKYMFTHYEHIMLSAEFVRSIDDYYTWFLILYTMKNNEANA